VSVLVNNAGITRPAMLERMSLEDWDAVLRANLTSQFLTTRAVAPHMIEARSGAIVNIASTVALRGGIGQVNYIAAKAGVIGLTKGSALELARYGIRVNAIAPGTIETDMTRTILQTPKFRQRYVDTIPIGRVGNAHDIANAVVFLASDRAAFITGEVVFVDGGAFM
jgi:3-oxoacyl-[acyl-carrier protein] reductase